MAEIRSAQTNTSEQSNAPKDSTEQQAAQSIIGEGTAAPGNIDQQKVRAAARRAARSGAGEGRAARGSIDRKAFDEAARAGQAAQVKPVEPGAASTQAEG